MQRFGMTVDSFSSAQLAAPKVSLQLDSTFHTSSDARIEPVSSLKHSSSRKSSSKKGKRVKFATSSSDSSEGTSNHKATLPRATLNNEKREHNKSDYLPASSKFDINIGNSASKHDDAFSTTHTPATSPRTKEVF